MFSFLFVGPLLFLYGVPKQTISTYLVFTAVLCTRCCYPRTHTHTYTAHERIFSFQLPAQIAHIFLAAYRSLFLHFFGAIFCCRVSVCPASSTNRPHFLGAILIFFFSCIFFWRHIWLSRVCLRWWRVFSWRHISSRCWRI